MVKLFLKSGVNPNAKYRGFTAILLAIMYGHTKIVKLLLKSGVNVDIKDKNIKTALYIAYEKGYTKIINLLEKYNSKQ